MADDRSMIRQVQDALGATSTYAKTGIEFVFDPPIEYERERRTYRQGVTTVRIRIESARVEFPVRDGEDLPPAVTVRECRIKKDGEPYDEPARGRTLSSWGGMDDFLQELRRALVAVAEAAKP